MSSLLRALAVALVALACACEETPAPKVPGPTTAKPPSETETTGAGKDQVRRIAQQDPAAKVVAFRIVFQAGSADDPSGKEGLTALAASMVAESGTTKLTFGELSKKYSADPGSASRGIVSNAHELG